MLSIKCLHGRIWSVAFPDTYRNMVLLAFNPLHYINVQPSVFMYICLVITSLTDILTLLMHFNGYNVETKKQRAGCTRESHSK